MRRPEEWTQAEAEAWASAYNSLHVEAVALTRKRDELKEQLRRWLELNDCDKLIDAETGEGVMLGKAPDAITWDTRAMNPGQIDALRAMGLLEVRTAAFRALRKAAPSLLLEELDRPPYKIVGEGTRPFKVTAREE